MNSPKLTLVGAGPGDPELITLKAIKALKSADVVLYDHLASQDLLEYAETAELVYVGKRGHKRGISQEQINELIVEKAFEKGHVVRLKGGDPFVFGRGVEEINFVTERGIPASYIPGVSSVNSIGLSGIPLTDRNSADGYWVITGHKKDGSLSSDIALASQSNSTLVILMGMSKLAEIEAIFSSQERTNVPVAIIQHVSTQNEKLAIGTVGSLVALAEENELTNPAVIVIGEVVNALKNGFGEALKEQISIYQRVA
ncbi:uroporphyrinogen-III C-methyltransferase [Arcticibacterium luteifluviistationis]|uniref:uroporphyrinogen-III C-methyltransferase n=1 Tax=Arcticibacterium luteifluviistationis TaxID=1784714 RepID=A0A2Z4GC00_9BACT|nr:uroporphyrinogen-III C-methyltransferase [Arcticibacterium luteifluviistationis]AWV98600.1 uroporphyrinogen-III C-methyltransferase [Arcticibacterium luteifluviistationis]